MRRRFQFSVTELLGFTFVVAICIAAWLSISVPVRIAIGVVAVLLLAWVFVWDAVLAFVAPPEPQDARPTVEPQQHDRNG